MAQDREGELFAQRGHTRYRALAYQSSMQEPVARLQHSLGPYGSGRLPQTPHMSATAITAVTCNTQRNATDHLNDRFTSSLSPLCLILVVRPELKSNRLACPYSPDVKYHPIKYIVPLLSSSLEEIILNFRLRFLYMSKKVVRGLPSKWPLCIGSLRSLDQILGTTIFMH